MALALQAVPHGSGGRSFCGLHGLRDPLNLFRQDRARTTTKILERPKLTRFDLDPHGITRGTDFHLVDSKLLGYVPGCFAWQTIICQTCQNRFLQLRPYSLGRLDNAFFGEIAEQAQLAFNQPEFQQIRCLANGIRRYTSLLYYIKGNRTCKPPF